MAQQPAQPPTGYALPVILLRPLCWLLGHRWSFERTLFGPVSRCNRCGTLQRA
jgi:hypothetical protein